MQAYSVLLGESVTEGHPAQEYFRTRLDVLREKIAGVFGEVTGNDDRQALLDAASTLIAVMDGLQMQWLLNPDAVDMPRIVGRTMDELLDRLAPGE